MQRSIWRICLIALCLLGVLVTGCGQKGDLYLPTPAAQPAETPDHTEPEPDEDDDSGG